MLNFPPPNLSPSPLSSSSVSPSLIFVCYILLFVYLALHYQRGSIHNHEVFFTFLSSVWLTTSTAPASFELTSSMGSFTKLPPSAQLCHHLGGGAGIQGRTGKVKIYIQIGANSYHFDWPFFCNPADCSFAAPQILLLINMRHIERNDMWVNLVKEIFVVQEPFLANLNLDSALQGKLSLRFLKRKDDDWILICSHWKFSLSQYAMEIQLVLSSPYFWAFKFN